jgi:hypothetical protein
VRKKKRNLLAQPKTHRQPEYAQEQPEAGSVVGLIELSAAVSKVAMQEQGRNPDVRVSPRERVEEGVGRWTEIGALKARFLHKAAEHLLGNAVRIFVYRSY